MKAAVALLSLIFVLPVSAQAQLTSACQSACGLFGDQYSCQSCLGHKAMKQRSRPDDPLFPDTRGPPKGGLQRWEDQQYRDELMKSQQQFDQLCIDTAAC